MAQTLKLFVIVFMMMLLALPLSVSLVTAFPEPANAGGTIDATTPWYYGGYTRGRGTGWTYGSDAGRSHRVRVYLQVSTSTGWKTLESGASGWTRERTTRRVVANRAVRCSHSLHRTVVWHDIYNTSRGTGSSWAVSSARPTCR